MTATPTSFTAWYPEGIGTQLPAGASLPAQASAQAGLGQFIFFDASGNVALNDGTVPGLISAGVAWPEKISDLSTTAGVAQVGAWWGFGAAVFSTSAGDAFTAADQCVPAWGATENTIGKLSSAGRSLVGLVFGLNADGLARLWAGPVAQAVARGILAAGTGTSTALLGSHTYAVDAGAATDLTEVIFSNPRAKQRGTVTAIEFIANATLAADATNYKTLTVTKYDSTGSNGVVVGTMTTVLVTTKWAAKAFTLSATAANLQVAEGDIFTIQNSHAASGAVTPAGVLRVLGKAGL